eukprot:Em0013g815a
MVLMSSRSVSSQSAPQLVVQLQAEYSVTLWDGQTTIKCAYTHYTTIEWRRFGQRLLDVVQAHSPYTDGHGTLVLSNAKASDSGNYTCLATNSAGTSSVSTYITISDQPDTQIWLSEWIIFVYCFALWLIVSLGLILLFCCRRKLSKQPKAPLNGDEVFIVDQNRHSESNCVEDTQTSQIYVAPDGQGFCGQGYPNPGFTTNQSKSVHTTVVTNRDGTVTTITKTTEHTLVPLDPTMQPSSLVMIPIDPSLMITPLDPSLTVTTFKGQSSSIARQKKRKSSSTRNVSETSTIGNRPISSTVEMNTPIAHSSYTMQENGENTEICDSMEVGGNIEVGGKTEVGGNIEVNGNIEIGGNTEVGTQFDENTEIGRNNELDGNIDGENILNENDALTESGSTDMPPTVTLTDDGGINIATNETEGRRNRWNFSIATNVVTSGNRRKNSSNAGYANSRGKRRVSSSSSTLVDSKLQLVEVGTEEPFVHKMEDEVGEVRERSDKLTQATPL